MFANAGITEKGTLLVDKQTQQDGEGEGEGEGKGPVKPDLRTLEVNLLGVIYCMDLFFPFFPIAFLQTGLSDINEMIGDITAVKLAIHYISKNEPATSSTSTSTTTPSAGTTTAAATIKSKGSIICTASNAGLYPFPIAPIYATAKHGVIGLVRSLARPLQKEHIQINALAPAVIGTCR